MDRITAQHFFDNQVKTRWPDWEPEGVEVSDWLFWIGKTDEDTALQAIREHVAESRWKRPTLSKFRTYVRLKAPPGEKTEQPDPTVFVMYEGGGRGTLLAGYHFPIIVRPGDNAMKAAERMRSAHEERVGGEWKVYSDATYPQMNGMRHEFYANRTEQKGSE